MLLDIPSAKFVFKAACFTKLANASAELGFVVTAGFAGRGTKLANASAELGFVTAGFAGTGTNASAVLGFVATAGLAGRGILAALLFDTLCSVIAALVVTDDVVATVVFAAELALVTGAAGHPQYL